jgi:hypothetical protein
MQLLSSLDQGIKCLLTRLTNFLRILGEFSINNITGEITTNVSLDREEKSHFMLQVIAQDGDPVAPRSNSTAVYITIVDENDNSPEFSKSRETIHVFEDVAVGFSVANVSDSDGGDDGDGGGDDDGGDDDGDDDDDCGGDDDNNGGGDDDGDDADDGDDCGGDDDNNGGGDDDDGDDDDCGGDDDNNDDDDDCSGDDDGDDDDWLF